MAKPTPARSLETFKAETDPLHKLLSPQDVLSRELRPGTKCYIITAAQNATPVHEKFWDALLSMAKHRNAEILVVPIRYKNPTSSWSGSQRNAEHWDEPVQPYLWNQRHTLNANIVLAADVKTQPTASKPTSGFEGLTGGESTILGHTRLQLRVVPTPQSNFPKILTTTGACTVPNYTDSKTGKLGHFHHTLGAAVVELDGKEFHIRQINANAQTGVFHDRDMAYGPVLPPVKAGRPEAISLGDYHRDFVSPDVEYATFGPGGIIPTLRPRRIFWHDLNDGYATNPHECENPFIEMGKRLKNRHRARPEMERSLQYVVEHTPADTESIIVFSNHNRFLARWIEDTDWMQLKDRDNVLFYFETATRITRSIKWGETGVEYDDAFTSWARELLPKSQRFRVLDRDEAYMVGDVDYGGHGDDGPNGARGSLGAYSKLGVKTNTGHDHVGGIEGGATRGGTSTRRYAGYTHGPSSWMNTHVLQYATNKRTLLNIIGRKWHG